MKFPSITAAKAAMVLGYAFLLDFEKEADSGRRDRLVGRARQCLIEALRDLGPDADETEPPVSPASPPIQPAYAEACP